ncbi:MAG TPA: AAA family ATPase, partial [Lamprocystis sp. (in: g-proteobacteria)]|nr:AAA family ATPase [Lamprocystis sp. (in: g-proteobacteria)]
LIHCRPYAPEGKGKLERWHRTLRDQFLSEIDWAAGVSLEDANARLWAWIEALYHRQPHGGLEPGMTPLMRYQQDLPRIRTLGPLAGEIDALFHHRIERLVRRDGTVSYQGARFEVPFPLAGRTVRLVVDPHRGQVVGVEDAEGRSLGPATPLDAAGRPGQPGPSAGPRPPARSRGAGQTPCGRASLAGRPGRYPVLRRPAAGGVMNTLQHFGLKHLPLGKGVAALWQDPPLTLLDQRFQALLEAPGIGLLTGEPGVGKTAALRRLAQGLNPHRYVVVYLAETDFGRLDLYRSLALALGLEPAHRRAALWRDLKARIQELADAKRQLPVWIVDEAQNLPHAFFRDLPAFLNFAFDSRDLISVWLVGHP